MTSANTYLFLLFIEIINNYSYKQIEGEKRSEYNEKYEI